MVAEKRHFVCVVCPIGCEIDVVHEGRRIISMEGNKCEKSTEFVTQELIEPMRILTSTVRIQGARWAVVPVRSDKAVPKRLFPRIMKQLRRVRLQAPVSMLDVVVKDVLDTGANIIATRTMPRGQQNRLWAPRRDQTYQQSND
jgi:CxxC motif-containing protein